MEKPRFYNLRKRLYGERRWMAFQAKLAALALVEETEFRAVVRDATPEEIEEHRAEKVREELFNEMYPECVECGCSAPLDEHRTHWNPDGSSDCRCNDCENMALYWLAWCKEAA